MAAWAAMAKQTKKRKSLEEGHKRKFLVVVDDTPEKIGRFSPGNGIPIVDRSVLERDPPDYLVILAWNFAREIMDNTASYSEQGGKYIIPIPSFSIVNS